MDQYNLFAFHVPDGSKGDDILQYPIKNDHTSSKFRPSPMTTLGSQWYHNRVRDKMNPSDLVKLTGGRKKQMYRVINPFEHTIDDHQQDINSVTKQYFGLKDEVILSRAFYKLWEIVMEFDVINQKEPINVITLAEAPGSFLQTIIHYRNKIVGQKKDSFDCITIHGEDLDEGVPRMHKTFIDKYKKVLTIHPTCCLQESKTSKLDNGDLTDIKTIDNFYNRIKKGNKFGDFITADGGFNWDDEKYQEPEAYTLLLGEIITALRVQNKNGHFVLKVFSTFTTMTIKLILILQSFYKDVYVTKPLTSRMSNSERYVVCKFFKTKPNDKKTLEKVDTLVQILKKIKSDEQKGLYPTDIFPTYSIPFNILKIFRYTSMHQSNLQMIQINNMMKYLRESNFYGEKYHQYRTNQIDANNAWVKQFYPPSKKVTASLNDCSKMIKATMDKYKSDADKFPYIIDV